eukprot:TRINITY_DN32782_c0_g1_i1.p1 TRINITY_DN32782_c0_g1~~TRINITY_DN32782_c0_g1_i1.p1  ORF type:complete len:194 (+),score=18.46 TRINITY_DN32782_c0_g1_i1:49-630(+)
MRYDLQAAEHAPSVERAGIGGSSWSGHPLVTTFASKGESHEYLASGDNHPWPRTEDYPDDPHLNRIAEEVDAKLDRLETHYPPGSSETVVVPTFGAVASGDVHVVLGKQSGAKPDLGTPLDDVNKLIERVDNAQQDLLPTSSLLVKVSALPLASPALAVLSMTCSCWAHKQQALGCRKKCKRSARSQLASVFL